MAACDSALATNQAMLDKLQAEVQVRAAEGIVEFMRMHPPTRLARLAILAGGCGLETQGGPTYGARVDAVFAVADFAGLQ